MAFCYFGGALAFQAVPDGRTPLTSPQSTPEIATDDFVRRFAMRTSNLMWFLGAGASASSIAREKEQVRRTRS